MLVLNIIKKIGLSEANNNYTQKMNELYDEYKIKNPDYQSKKDYQTIQNLQNIDFSFSCFH